MAVRTPSVRDYVWGSIAGFVTVCAVLRLLVFAGVLVWALARLHYLSAVKVAGLYVPTTALGGYWFGVGAWRRTVWGAPSEEERAEASRPLTKRQANHLRNMVIVGAACAVVLSIALGAQALIGHW